MQRFVQSDIFVGPDKLLLNLEERLIFKKYGIFTKISIQTLSRKILTEDLYKKKKKKWLHSQ